MLPVASVHREKMHKKKFKSKFISAAWREDGQMIDEQKKRETVKGWCKEGSRTQR